MANYTSGEIIVAFRKDLTSAEAEKVITDFGLSVKDNVAMYYLVEVPAGSEEKWVEEFKKLPVVRIAERNGIVSLPHPWGPQ